MSDDLVYHESPYERIVDVQFGAGVNILEVDYPSDSDYEIFPGITIDTIPPIGRYKVGDKVDKTLVTGAADSKFDIFAVDFDENNPVGREIGGQWKTGFLYDTPRLWSIPVIPIVDGIHPNPFHDADQNAMDIWHAHWVKQVQDMYDYGNTNLPEAIIEFQKAHDKTRILTVSSFSEFEPTPKDGWGFSDYYYNNPDTLQYVSQVGSALIGGELIKQTLDLSLVWNKFGTNLSTGTGGFALTIDMRAQQGTLVVGQFWVPVETKKDVWLINKKKLTAPATMRIEVSSKSAPDIARATITYKTGVGGAFTVAAGRQLTTAGKPQKSITKTVSMKDAGGTIMAKFDGNGFV